MDQAKRTAIVIIFALFTDGLLYGLIIPVIPYSPVQLSADWMYEILSGSYAFALILATPIFGVFSDTIGRRKPMLISALIQVMAVVMFANASNFAYLLLAKFAQGIAASATWTAGLALLTENFSTNRAQMLGYAMLGNTCGLVFGPVAGGLLLDAGGFRFPFIVAGIIIAFDLLLRFKWVKDLPRKMHVPKKQLFSLLYDKTVLVVAVIIGLGAWCWSTMEPLFPLYLQRVSKASAGQTGAVFTVGSIISGLCSPLIGKFVDRVGAWQAMMIGLILFSLSIPLLCVSRSIIISSLFLVIVNIAYVFVMNPPWTELSIVADNKKIDGYASIYAIYNVAYSVGMLGSNLTNGMLTRFFSIPIIFSLMGAGVFFIVVILFLIRARQREERKLQGADFLL